MATFTNQAQLSYNNSTASSNVAVGELVSVLSAEKTVLNPDYTNGDTITYIVNLVNTGDTAYTGLTLSDNLGAYQVGEPAVTVYPLSFSANTIKYYTNGVLQTTPAVTVTQPLTVTGISVPAKGNATIVYETTANNFAPLAAGSSINNTATISGVGTTDLTASASIAVADAPALNITKSISSVPVSENGTLTYTFLIQNTGNAPADAADLVTLTDTFNPRLANLSVTYNNAAWAQTNYSYDETTGVFATTAGAITVPAATYTQNAQTGEWTIVPGTSTLVVSGTV